MLFFDRDEDMLSMASLISTNTSDIAHLDDFDEEDLGRFINIIILHYKKSKECITFIKTDIQFSFLINFWCNLNG